MGRSEVWDLLDVADPFFNASWADLPEEARSLLRALDTTRAALRAPGRQITVVGAFKTGKSSLINALAGAPILPVHAHRGTGATTRIRYGATFRGEVHGDAVPPDDLAGRIFLEEGAELHGEVNIEASLPLMDGLWDVADTPGLFKSTVLTDSVMRELDSADLVLLVLAADQILSAQERAAAAHIDRLLRGNVIYVVNRIDLIDEAERDDVLDWARHSVGSSGNSLIGRPCIVQTAARPGQEDGIDTLRDRLLEICTTEMGERVAVLSRLGRLSSRLDAMAEELRGLRLRHAASLEAARAAALVAVEDERAQIRRSIAQGRWQLAGVREELPGLEEAFVHECVEDTWRALKESSDPELVLNPSLAAYRQAVSDRVMDAVLDLPVTVPSWQLSTWVVRARVEAAGHVTIDIGAALGDLATRVLDGGQRGREAGAALGGWLSKSVFGVDVEAETRKRLEHAARALLPALRAETGEYIRQIDDLLASADGYYVRWTHSSPQIAAMEREEEIYGRLDVWLGGFREKAEELIARVDHASE